MRAKATTTAIAIGDAVRTAARVYSWRSTRACVAAMAAIPFVYRATRDLDFRYNVPEIVSAGIPVDLDAAARRQHDAAMGPAEPAAPQLIQIVSLPPAPPPPVAGPEEPRTISGNESD